MSTTLAAVEASTPSSTSLNRYARQIVVAPIGRSGQDRIAAAHVLVVGCGALGGASANLLARAGFGSIAVADRDYVELHNLQRQTLFTEEDVRDHVPKAIAAARRLRSINSEIAITPVVTDVNPQTIEPLLDGVDLIVDGLDNFEGRYLINDAAVKHGVPWIYGGVIGTQGTTMTIRPDVTPCLRCVFPEQPGIGAAPTCDTAGVLGPVVEMVAALQATEAMKLAVGDLDAVNRRLVSVDVWSMSLHGIQLPGPYANCPTCGLRRFDALDGGAANESVSLCGHDAVQILAPNPTTLDLAALEARMAPSGATLRNRFLLRFRPTVSDHDLTIFPDGRAIIKGTTDPVEARSLYAKYLGS